MPASPEDSLRNAAKEFIVMAGITCSEKHSEYIVRIAQAFADVQNPKKAEKILRELEYDAVLMDSLENRILEYMGLKNPSIPFRAFWKSLCKLLMRLQLEDNSSFHRVVKGIVERPITLRTDAPYAGNFFEEIKSSLEISGVPSENFLRGVYSLNHQVGMNPSGKGEHLLLLFLGNSRKSSDISLEVGEIEVKTSGAPVGEVLGSKIVYREKLHEILNRVGKGEEIEKLSFGSRDFVKNWAPFFVELCKEFPEIAQEFLSYQSDFYLREHVPEISYFLENPTIHSLASFYDRISVEYVNRSLQKSTGMIVFESKPTGKFFFFPTSASCESVSFSGSSQATPLKIFFPKSSATMRPEIFISL